MSIVKHTYSCWNDQVVDWLKTEEMMNGKCRVVFVGVNTGCLTLRMMFVMSLLSKTCVVQLQGYLRIMQVFKF